MNPRKRPLQALSVIVLTLTALLLAARALAPTAAPRPAPAVDDLTANLLSGTVTGLDPGDGVRLQLERLAEAGVNGHGEIVDRFDIVNGPWQQQGLALLPGQYRLIPEAKGYVHVPRSIVIQVPEEGIVWRYTDLDFEFLHPEDARSRLGLPLCPELPSPVVAVTVVPQGTRGHTPQPESMPPDAPAPSSGMCYGNHLADVRLVPAGLQGRISGLPDGQTATITLYELSPLPDELYGQGEPPSPDSSWTYPPEVARLEETPAITPDWSLTATLVAENGRWGLADPSLAGKKYLAVASAPDQIVDPPAYEVVIFAGKALGFPGDVDFAFGPSPVAHPIPAASADELAELVQGNTAFAFDLYQILRSERDGNFLYSPYSVSLALAMAYAGARGETERQMANTLHFSLPQERLHPSLHTLGQEMSRHGTNGQGFWMNVANALWGQEDIRFLPEFIDLLAVSYGAEMRHLDFAREEQARKAINDWVGQQTEGRIKELLPPGVLDGTTRLLLINAVYFNAAWARQFDPRHTEYGVFHLLNGGSVMVKMMRQAEQFAYTEGLDYQAVELPYEHCEIAMIILLPAQGRFDAVERSLDAEHVEGILENLAGREMSLVLPRFEFEASFDLEAAMAAMGMPQAFAHQADFSGMTSEDELFIGDLLHKATISVGEAGTEATGATAAVMPTTGEPVEVMTVAVDRPFLFLIRDLRTGTILFMGRVTNPLALVED